MIRQSKDSIAARSMNASVRFCSGFTRSGAVVNASARNDQAAGGAQAMVAGRRLVVVMDDGLGFHAVVMLFLDDRSPVDRLPLLDNGGAVAIPVPSRSRS